MLVWYLDGPYLTLRCEILDASPDRLLGGRPLYPWPGRMPMRMRLRYFTAVLLYGAVPQPFMRRDGIC